MTLKLKIPPPLVGLICAALMWFVADVFHRFDFDFSYKTLLALVVGGVGVLLDALALTRFRAAKTTINPIKPDTTSELVVSGIYQHTRNPMYLGVLFLLTGWGIYLGNYMALAILPVFVIYITVFQIIPEEKVLDQLFGQAYRDYKAKVRRWV